MAFVWTYPTPAAFMVVPAFAQWYSITQARAPFSPSSPQTVLPFQTQGTQDRCLNGSSVVCTKAMPVSLYAAVKLLCTKSGEYAPCTCLEGCVFGQPLAL